MYTAYCGREMMMPSAVFHGIYTAIEKEGEIVIDCIYDGSFTGKKIPGHGIFADMAISAGYRVIDVEDMHLFSPE